MKKLSTIEKRIHQIITQEDSPAEERQAFENMLQFWKVHDEIFGTGHVEMIQTLYQSDIVTHPNSVKMAELHMSESTLIRQRKRYVESFFALNRQLQPRFEC